MPVAPPKHKPIAIRTASPISSNNNSYGKGRGGWKWTQKRKRIFERDKYLCQIHLAEGKLVPVSLHGPNAGICDHILPISQGGKDDESNLQTLCKECSDVKTRNESNRILRAAILPQWMPKPTKPLIVVCGPPRAGKNTYISEHAAPEDLIIDLDAMATEYGIARERNRSYAEITLLIRERNNRLADFCRNKTDHPKCWLISTAGSFKQRKFWKDLGAEVIVINPGAALCKQRIMEDTRKEEYVKLIRMKAVDNWR